jgi:hypothetical protein
MNNCLNICIPRINNTIQRGFIQKTLYKLNIGDVKSIKIVGSGDKRTVFINFNRWYDNVRANYIYGRLVKEESVNIVYEFPWFWKCVMVNNNKFISEN